MHATHFAPVLLNLDEEAVGAWISHMINMATESFTGDENEMWHPMHFNPWCQAQENATATGGEHTPIHYRVKCDGCGVFPIRGIRYKCGVCSNYDLCEKCEALNEHDPQHILLKINRPIMCRLNFGRHDFVGLREVIGEGQRRGRGRGGRCGRWYRAARFGNENENEHGCEFPMHGFGGPCQYRHPSQYRHPCWMNFACQNKEKEKEQNKSKLQHKKEKLMENLATINSKLHGNDNNDQDHKNENNNALQIKCVCGGWLVQITPAEAYPHRQVLCDICEMDCTREKKIYHCPMERSLKHPGGYDVCLKCANDDDSNLSSYGFPEQEQEQENPIVVEKEKRTNIKK